MSLIRSDSFREMALLQDHLNRLFTPTSSRREELTTSAWPAVDIHEDAEGITFLAELPGLDPKAVAVKIENQVLTLSGERKREREEQRGEYHRVERWCGSFSRSFSLPPTVNVEKVQATHRNGLLQVFLPRREETKPRQITVDVQA